jgi:Cu2+-exporting ATPase
MEHAIHHDHHQPTHDAGGHDKHAGHNVADFWKRFIICSIVSIPVLALSHMIQQWLGFEFSFVGDKYVLAGTFNVHFCLWWLSFSERLI